MKGASERYRCGFGLSTNTATAVLVRHHERTRCVSALRRSLPPAERILHRWRRKTSVPCERPRARGDGSVLAALLTRVDSRDQEAALVEPLGDASAVGIFLGEDVERSTR